MIASIAAAAIRLFTGVRAFGDSPGRGCIYYARHKSHLDTLVIWAALPQKDRKQLRPVAARDYWDKTFLRRWLSRRVLKAILLDRKPCAGCKSHPLRELADAVESGDSLLIFPEGTRSPQGDDRPFKSGIYHLAKMLPDSSFIPVSLENLGRILPKGEFLPLPLIARCSIGEALTLRADETKPAFLQRSALALTPSQS